MKLNLSRPLMFFDLETTGTNPLQDRIVEISTLKVYPDGHEEEYCTRVNPGIPIPPETTAVHHITDADVADKPTFAQIADNLLSLFADCDIAGYNSNKFDVPMLMAEFERVGKALSLMGRRLVDVQNIFYVMEPRTLTAAYKFYCGKELVGAHSAASDVRATYEVLMGQLDRYEKLRNDLDELAKLSATKFVDIAGRIGRNAAGDPIMNFGKYKGKTVEWVCEHDPGFLNWMLASDFPNNTKDVIRSLRYNYQHKKR